ncbi:DUF1934 domain-containing protein [Virgibacillus sp. C22-A2]|uniref:DUF1934 domain-containing protein n=1 Tax=Virgibacillus tibetensis TaxID=3042313 RepID=A0ABU6KGZ0_9BACI|nr:DUF1934 domain-containing protein [Virgibacillus sp. C22-A2]
MGSEQIKIRIELSTTIDDNGQMEYNNMKHSGNFYKKNNLDVLTFEEEAEDKSIVKNLITIQPDKVSIKRSGNVTMNQQFRANHKTENVLQHPHGIIHMETFTDLINYQSVSKTKEGRLTISYTVKLNGQEARRHDMELVYKEEVSQ